MSKPKVAFYWCASCGGCEETVIDLNERVLDVVAAVDIVFWPVAIDTKYEDVRKMGDGEIAVAFINGAIRTSEQEEMAGLLRKKSGLVVAFGSCAHLGGIPGLANFSNREGIMARAYREGPSVENPSGVMPQERTTVDGIELTLPRLYDTVMTLDQVIDVDYYLPGCPPPADTVATAVEAILAGKLPAKGSVLAPEKTLCETCPLNESKPERLAIDRIVRVHEIAADSDTCFLAQGIVCVGPATRGGCGEQCINAKMPCRGCFGAPGAVRDQGAKQLSGLASLFSARREEAAEELAAQVADPAGTFYRFGLPASMLRRKVER